MTYTNTTPANWPELPHGMKWNKTTRRDIGRARSAYKLAEHKAGTTPTVGEVEAAALLLAKCRRHGNTSAKQWERENTPMRDTARVQAMYRFRPIPENLVEYCDTPECEAANAKLERRTKVLNAELAPYGAALIWPGLYPEICSTADHGARVCELYPGE